MSHEATPEPYRFSSDRGQSLAEFVAQCPAGSVIRLAPGRYVGPLRITWPLTLQGAGDLTRISAEGQSHVIMYDSPDDRGALLDSLLLEDGAANLGGGIHLKTGCLRLYNVQIRSCKATGTGGAIHVHSGELHGARLRVRNVSAKQGGAIYAGGNSQFWLSDSQITGTIAEVGGAIALESAARGTAEDMTISKTRATLAGGGQAIHLRGREELAPALYLRRVRLEDAPLGMPIVIDPHCTGRVELLECDVPRVLRDGHGIFAIGENVWR